MLFYAEKYHLQRYGRPICGDVYIKMPYGPVGSFAYDILKRSDFLPEGVLKEIDGSLEIRRRAGIPSVSARRKADLDRFSETDLECLNEAINRCKESDFKSLTQTVHKEKAWQKADMYCEMDYELFIDEALPDREELISYLRETAQTSVL
ncbi:MAG: Panacea domain-containing protein [Desulfonauticus sp.]|nr:Panacea domain-containing protein [Desulfonauticus sp.]